jgi:hypothetical protein
LSFGDGFMDCQLGSRTGNPARCQNRDQPIDEYFTVRNRHSCSSTAADTVYIDRRLESVAARFARPQVPHLARAYMLGHVGSKKRVTALRAGRHGEVSPARRQGWSSRVERHERASVRASPSSEYPVTMLLLRLCGEPMTGAPPRRQLPAQFYRIIDRRSGSRAAPFYAMQHCGLDHCCAAASTSICVRSRHSFERYPAMIAYDGAGGRDGKSFSHEPGRHLGRPIAM